MSPRTTARRSACRISARSAPTASPIRATSRRPVAWFEDRDEPTEVDPEVLAAVDDDARPLAARRRRVARQSRAVPLRPRALQHDRDGQLRPSRSVDLHGADLAERRARPRQCRLRDLPAALDGGGGHVPPALVPPQRDERGMGLIHGAYDAKAEGFAPGGLSLHNLMSGARSRRRKLDEGASTPSSSRTRSTARWPSCSRLAGLTVRRDRARSRAARVRPAWKGFPKAKLP